MTDHDEVKERFKVYLYELPRFGERSLRSMHRLKYPARASRVGYHSRGGRVLGQVSRLPGFDKLCRRAEVLAARSAEIQENLAADPGAADLLRDIIMRPNR